MDKFSTGTFCWQELATPNTQAAKDFYGKMFGWTFVDHAMQDMTYTMISTGDKAFGGIWQIPNDQKDTIPPHWMGYILVQDLQVALDKATSLGATIKMPVTKVGEDGRFAVLVDPTGAHIAFWESSKG